MELADKFKALGDKTRLRIIGLLLVKELCVCEIMDVLGMSQSRISRHLKILRHAGFIEEERRGKWVFYRVVDGNKGMLSYVKEMLKREALYKTDTKKIIATLKKRVCQIRD
jgi:ArsR family transcriptional regulator